MLKIDWNIFTLSFIQCAGVQPWLIQGIQSGDSVAELDTIVLIKY